MPLDIHLVAEEIDAATTASWDYPLPPGTCQYEYPVESDGNPLKENNSVAGGELLVKVVRCPDMLTINSVKLWVRFGPFSIDPMVDGERTFELAMYTGGVPTYSGVVRSSSEDLPELVWDSFNLGATDPTTGLPWSAAAVRSKRWGMKTDVFGGVGPYGKITGFDLIINGEPFPSGIEPAREVMSRLVRELSAQPGQMELKGRMSLFAREIGEMLDVSDIDGEEASGAGWGTEPYLRRIHEVQERTLNLDDMTSQVLLQDVRTRVVTYYDSGMSSVAGSGDRPGVIRLDPGALRSLDRNSAAWSEDPIDGRIKQAGVGSESLGIYGENLERASTCWFKRCAMKAGLTGLTTNGEGSAGSNISANTNPLLLWFDPDEIPYSLRFDGSTVPAGAPDLEALWPVTVEITGTGIISIRHTDSSGDPLSWWLQRSGDSKYWRNSDATWQAAKTWNAMPTGVKLRYISKPITGLAGDTLQLGVGMPGGGASVAGQTNFVFKVQGETHAWASTDIVCDTTIRTREDGQVYMTNDSGKRILQVLEGGFSMRWMPFFNSADVPGGFVALLYYAEYGSNYQKLYYDKTAGAIKFVRHVGGVSYTVSFPTTITRLQTFDILTRWTGTNGAFHIPDYSLGMVVNGVETDWTTSVALPETSPTNLYFYEGSNFPEGGLSYVVGWYFPFSLAEARRLPL